MAYSRSDKVSPERRLKILTKQLYGGSQKPRIAQANVPMALPTGLHSLDLVDLSTKPTLVAPPNNSYLQRDLLRIVSLASLIFTVQLVLKLILKF